MAAPATEDATKALIEELRNHPDFIHLPFPKDWYKKYDIPEPTPLSFKAFLDSGYWFDRHYDPKVERITIGPAPGGVRPVPEPEVIPVETITKPIDAETQTDEDNQQTTTPKSAHSTESSEKEHLD
jgi:hypothetical protein